MNEGLYKAEFETPFGRSTAVIYLYNGLFRGGNSALFYVGIYELKGNSFSAVTKVKRHSQDLNIASVFGMDNINVIIEGEIEGNIINIDGVATEVPDMQMRGKLTRLSD
ncbi:hypothetical protein A9Q83_13550 [Alphaproteobacteria bacterium 46_93_T64]|nr:hypothetical protein A9Q83_13550 [Alphaproteobacteria bacterium 46_93_T64]